MSWLALALFLAGKYQDFMNAIVSVTGPRVVRPMTLRQYFDEEVRLPRWKQRDLLRNDAVRVRAATAAGGTPAIVTNPDHPLSEGDVVEYDETNTRYLGEAVPKIMNAKDYAFVPDADPEDEFVTFLSEIQNRKNSWVFGSQDVDPASNLEGIVKLIGKDDAVFGPPRHVVIISHAHWSGQLAFSPTAATEEAGRMVTYETIDAAPEKLKVPDSYLKDRSDANQPPTLVFSGCEIGTAEAFLKKLRNMMNPKFRVYAPKFWFGAARTPDQELYFEFMEIAFYVHSTSPLLRSDLIQTLSDQTPPRRRRDAWNDPIEPGNWESWVPEEPWPTKTGFLKSRSIPVVMPRLAAGGRVFPERQINLPGQLWLFKADLKGTVPTTVPKSVFDDNPLEAFRQTVASLGPSHVFSDSHPFPVSRRFHFASANDLIANILWDLPSFRYETGSRGNALFAKGSAFKYCVLVPITEKRPSRKLIANYYLAGNTTAIRSDLGFEKDRFWGVIPPA